MIAELITITGLIVDCIDEHPALAKKIAGGLRDLLKAHPDASINPESLRGLAAGMAADRAQAVQAFARRKARKKK